jgi:hypothetical protein
VGAGPAGISASLRAIERGLTYLALERETIGGAVTKYPRQKLVMTSPIEFPLGFSLNRMQLSKEKLLEFWAAISASRDAFDRILQAKGPYVVDEGPANLSFPRALPASCGAWWPPKDLAPSMRPGPCSRGNVRGDPWNHPAAKNLPSRSAATTGRPVRVTGCPPANRTARRCSWPGG